MADRAASAASLRVSTGPVYKIKVTQFDIDTEIRLRRSITSDNYTTNGVCVPCTVVESVGGIIRGVGFVDPSDTFIAQMLAAVGTPVSSSDFEQHDAQFVFDVVADSAASRFGYTFGTTSGDAKIFPMNINGRSDDAGMIEITFEIHSQKGIQWLTNMT